MTPLWEWMVLGLGVWLLGALGLGVVLGRVLRRMGAPRTNFRTPPAPRDGDRHEVQTKAGQLARHVEEGSFSRRVPS
jgi:hypothetical protein